MSEEPKKYIAEPRGLSRMTAKKRARDEKLAAEEASKEQNIQQKISERDQHETDAFDLLNDYDPEMDITKDLIKKISYFLMRHGNDKVMEWAASAFSRDIKDPDNLVRYLWGCHHNVRKFGY